MKCEFIEATTLSGWYVYPPKAHPSQMKGPFETELEARAFIKSMKKAQPKPPPSLAEIRAAREVLART